MRRLIQLIALLFAFAAVGGVATSNAMAFSSLRPAPVEASACSDASAAASVVLYKACGKKGSGIVMPCAPQIGMLTEVGVLLPAPVGPSYGRTTAQAYQTQALPVSLRPPIAA